MTFGSTFIIADGIRINIGNIAFYGKSLLAGGEGEVFICFSGSEEDFTTVTSTVEEIDNLIKEALAMQERKR